MARIFEMQKKIADGTGADGNLNSGPGRCYSAAFFLVKVCVAWP